MKLLKTLGCILLCSIFCNAQNATITGLVFNEKGEALNQVNISTNKTGTVTDQTGFYVLHLTADIENTVTFSFLGYKDVILENIILSTNETFVFNPVLKKDTLQIDAVTVTANGQKKTENILTINPEYSRKIPGANAGVENILKLLPGVSSNNELSTQYAVRGGNYDENLVYVNEIEVYRPFLIRSAQQEGLSFVNRDFVQDLKFSAGGFQAKYGDKLSSVLTIKYKTPTVFSAKATMSFLGANASVEAISKNKKLSTITGIRYRNNAMLVNSQQTQSNFNPAFTDIQSYTSYRFSNSFSLDFLGNLSVNNYLNEPLNRQTNFGTINNPKTLVVFYDGMEKNRYATALAALKGTYFLNDKTVLKLISSLYHTTEEEYSDIMATYELGEVDSNLGGNGLGASQNTRGIGKNTSRSRNDLDALIVNIHHLGSYKKEKTLLEWGLKYSHEDIRDQLRESEFIDSAGFSVRPPRAAFTNNQPITPFTAPLLPYTAVNATNFVKTHRVSGFMQLGTQLPLEKAHFYYNLGIRAHHWTLDGDNIEAVSQTVWSPRAQIAIKPKWKKDVLFRLSGGIYHQPPFYRELRDNTGTINPKVKAQKAVHLVAANEYSFLLWGRPFKLLSEAYFKNLTNVNPYTLDDVRIRYAANNTTNAYVYGAEVRLNGAFVPGTESWLSMGLLNTKENRDGRGYIPRPTDQRFKFSVLFQDYIPNIPNIKMYLNLVYQTGVPGGSPSYADPYIFQNRLSDYRRADLGISYIFANKDNSIRKTNWFSVFKESSFGLEIFNLFNNQNSITNTWVRDADSKNQFAVPNFLTSRVFNLKFRIQI